VIYIFKSSSGTFSIEPDEQSAGMVKLCIGGLWLASFEKAEEAAHCVRCRETGWYDWDKRGLSETAPGDLGEWNVFESPREKLRVFPPSIIRRTPWSRT